jgi:endonuclease YncB( thermonuclease family)
VSIGGKNINLEIVEAGFAEVNRGDPAPGQDLPPSERPRKKQKLQKEGCGCKGRST